MVPTTKNASSSFPTYLQMNMYLTRLGCYMDSDGWSNMAVPGDVDQRDQGRSEGTVAADRVGEDTRSIDAEEPVGDAGGRCSRGAAVVGDAAVDPAARGEDDSAA
jgi:hypothetical protein